MRPTIDETTQLDARSPGASPPPSSKPSSDQHPGPTLSDHPDETDHSRPAGVVGESLPKIGRYELRQEIGAGTSGKVYLGNDPQLKRAVAIKLRHATQPGEGMTALLHEAQSVARLHHRGIVAVLDTGCTDDGRGYIVYEFVEGRNLKSRIAAGDFTRDDAISWVAETAEALHSAHTHGLVHRDVKPANILVDTAGHTRLADFGLAKIDDAFFADDAGRVLGTLAYMSPEQASGKSHWATPQSDVYSLGVVLYEMLCGRRPFNSESSMDLLEQVQHRPPAPPRTIHDDIPKPLEDICLRAMAKEPGDRYTTASDMAADLRTLFEQDQPRNSGLKFVAGGLAAGLLLFAVAWAFRDRFLGNHQIEPANVPGAEPSASVTYKPPELEIHLQRRLEDNDFVRLRQQHVPVVVGDKVQLHATLDRPGYAYLFWYDSEGRPNRLWPESKASLARQQRVDEIWSPAEAAKTGLGTKAWPVEGSSGAQLALVAVADEPLSDSDLAQFEKLTFVLSEELTRSRKMVEFVHPEPPTGSTPRGLGANPIVTSKRAVPELESELNKRFRAYHGWLFFQAGANP